MGYPKRLTIGRMLGTSWEDGMTWCQTADSGSLLWSMAVVPESGLSTKDFKQFHGVAQIMLPHFL